MQKQYEMIGLSLGGGGSHKPYFTELFPVEGEIKDGDYWIRDGKISNEVVAHGMCDCKKVELFLCSRDIQVGDKFYYLGKERGEITSIDNGFVYNGTGIRFPLSDCYKVIGEISPDALSYVKEGDEFDETKLGFGTSLSSTFTQEFVDIKNFKPAIEMCRKGEWFIKIKGPCGHFH